jgi:hypothetical protein
MILKEVQMRKALCAFTVAVAAALTASSAQAARYDRYSYPYSTAPAEATASVIGGTVVGLGVSEGWWGTTIAGAGTAALPTTIAGAAAVGGVVGIGGIALIDAVVQPCRGFHAMLDLNEQYCAERNAQRLNGMQRVGSRTYYRHRR